MGFRWRMFGAVSVRKNFVLTLVFRRFSVLYANGKKAAEADFPGAGFGAFARSELLEAA